MRRTPEWWLSAYHFMSQFKGYELKWDSFLEGLYHHYCLKQRDEWLGPEVVVYTPKNEFRFREDRLLR